LEIGRREEKSERDINTLAGVSFFFFLFLISVERKQRDQERKGVA